jgi:hypothetical protein
MSECGPTEEDATMPVDPEEELAENIRRFPERYPQSIGGLLPDSNVPPVVNPAGNNISLLEEQVFGENPEEPLDADERAGEFRD